MYHLFLVPSSYYKETTMIELFIVVSSFSLCVAREGFFPRPVSSSYVLAPEASMSEILLLGTPAIYFVLHDAQPLLNISSCVISESKRMIFSVSRFVLSLFWGGVLLGIMLAEHNARPLLKRSPCVIVLRANTQYFILSVLLRMNGDGIVDGYVPAKDIIPKNPYRVFLRYRLVKYRENTIQYRTEIPNQDATLQ